MKIIINYLEKNQKDLNNLKVLKDYHEPKIFTKMTINLYFRPGHYDVAYNNKFSKEFYEKFYDKNFSYNLKDYFTDKDLLGIEDLMEESEESLSVEEKSVDEKILDNPSSIELNEAIFENESKIENEFVYENSDAIYFLDDSGNEKNNQFLFSQEKKKIFNNGIIDSENLENLRIKHNSWNNE